MRETIWVGDRTSENNRTDIDCCILRPGVGILITSGKQYRIGIISGKIVDNIVKCGIGRSAVGVDGYIRGVQYSGEQQQCACQIKSGPETARGEPGAGLWNEEMHSAVLIPYFGVGF